MPAERDSGCSDPAVSDSLVAYVFHDLGNEEREAVGLHIVECDACWRELQRLERAVRALRFDPGLKPFAPNAELLSVVGLSSRLDDPFSGHGWFVASAAVLYGSLYTASIWTELGYSYDRFGALAWFLSPLVLVWAAASVAGALYVGSRLTQGGNSNMGLIRSGFVAVLGVGVLVLMLSGILPHEQTVSAAFTTRSAWAGFLKNVVFYFLPLLLFVIPPFHVVVSLQRELRLNRHAQVLQLLTGDAQAVPPRGVWFIRSWFLLTILLAGLFIGYIGTNNLLDNLHPGPYANLFTVALYLRVSLWYIVALLSLIWYRRNLDDLKREALLVTRLMNS